MEDLSLVLYNLKTGEETKLPEWVRLREASVSPRADYEDRASTHGAVLTGDGKIQAREIGLYGATDLFKTSTDHDDWMNKITMQLMYGKNRLIVGNRYYYNIDIPTDLSPTYEDGWGRQSSEFDFTLLATDPFKYDLNPTEQEYNFASRVSLPTDPDIEITITGADVYPTYIVTVTGNSATNMLFRNISDDNRTMTYKDPQMGNGKQVIINGTTGEVMRTQDGRRALNFFAGLPIRLVPGVNRIVYIGEEINLKMIWTNRRPF